MNQLSLWSIIAEPVPADALAYDEDGDILSQLHTASRELYYANQTVGQLSAEYGRLRHAVRQYLAGKLTREAMEAMVKEDKR